MVQSMMLTEARRKGSGFEDFRPAIIRQGVIRLQHLIEQYRVGHETVYQPQDFVLEGRASRGVKPPQSVVEDAFLYQTCRDPNTGISKASRFVVERWAWKDRYALTQGLVASNNSKAKLCFDPQGYTFYVYPFVADEWLFGLRWNGLKLDFNDLDETPFNEATAGAVAYFAMAESVRGVQQEAGLALKADYMRDFGMAAQQLFLAERDKSQLHS